MPKTAFRLWMPIATKYTAVCANCKVRYAVGTHMFWNHQTHELKCQPCQTMKVTYSKPTKRSTPATVGLEKW
jgi:hypothetical protein